MTRSLLLLLIVVLMLGTGGSPAARAADVDAGKVVYDGYCAACHGPASSNTNNIWVGANNPTAIVLQMQKPGSAMGFLQDLLDATDIANVAAYLAVVAGVSSAAPTPIPIIEYYHAGFDHYFITGIPDEITALDTGRFQGWARTGLQFTGYPRGTTGSAGVCRFFSTAFGTKSSHFYTPFSGECATVRTNVDWQFEDDAVFATVLPDAAGNCPAATTPVYRLYNNGQGGAPNHRYTTSLDVRSAMMAQGWIPEGLGPNAVIMCAP